MTDVRPLAPADGCDGFWVFGETAPSLAGRIDDVDAFDRRYCQIYSTGFSSGERDGRKISVMFFGTVSLLVVPSGAIEQQHAVRSPSDHGRDFVEVHRHGLGADVVQGQGGTDAARRADGPEQPGSVVALVGRLAGPRSPPRHCRRGTFF